MTTVRSDVGDTIRMEVTIREPKTGSNLSPSPIDLTGSLLIYEAKLQPERRRLHSTDEVVISKTSDDANEIEIYDQTQLVTRGKCQIKIRPEDTNFLKPLAYSHSLRLKTSGGDSYTVMKGQLILEGPATVEENMT